MNQSVECSIPLWKKEYEKAFATGKTSNELMEELEEEALLRLTRDFLNYIDNDQTLEQIDGMGTICQLENKVKAQIFYQERRDYLQKVQDFEYQRHR